MDLNWAEIFAWPSLLKCFIVGGLLCVIGQILIDKTKLTPARILVIFVTTGAVLGGLGIYQYLVDFAGAGAADPAAHGMAGAAGTGGAVGRCGGAVPLPAAQVGGPVDVRRQL